MSNLRQPEQIEAASAGIAQAKPVRCSLAGNAGYTARVPPPVPKDRS